MAGARNERQQRAEQMRRERERAERRRRNGITLAIMAVVVVLVAVAAFAIIRETGASDDPAAAPAGTTDDFGIVFDQAAAGTQPSAGAAEPVEVVVYEDFQCPVCQAFEQANGDFLDEQVAAGTITVETRPVSFLDPQSSTRYATRAANAAACVTDAAGAEGFHAFKKLLYENQPAEGTAGLTDDQLAEYADQAGANDVGSCLDDGTYEPWVEQATEAWRDAGFDGTPTVVVDGEQVSGTGGRFPVVADLQVAITAAQQ